jgi:hypothetical protein
MNLEKKLELFKKYDINCFYMLKRDFPDTSAEGVKEATSPKRNYELQGRYSGFGNKIHGILGYLGNIADRIYKPHRKCEAIQNIWIMSEQLHLNYSTINFDELDKDDPDFNVFYETADVIMMKNGPSKLQQTIRRIIDLSEEHSHENILDLPTYKNAIQIFDQLRELIGEYQRIKRRLEKESNYEK